VRTGSDGSGRGVLRKLGIGGGDGEGLCVGGAVAAGRPGGRDAPVDTASEVTPTEVIRPDRGDRERFRCIVS